MGRPCTITEKQISTVKDLHRQGLKQPEISTRLHIGVGTIRAILRGYRPKSLGGLGRAHYEPSKYPSQRNPVKGQASRDAETVQRVLALKEEGLSYRAIGERLGIHHNTAKNIVYKQHSGNVLSTDEIDDVLSPSGTPTRCPGCGGLVYMPCKLCKIRTLVAHQKQLI
jgi:transposase